MRGSPAAIRAGVAIAVLLATGALRAGPVGARPCEPVAPGGPEDCNGNGYPDACDLGPHALGFSPRSIIGMVPESRFDFSSFTFSPADLDGDGDGDFTVHAEGTIRAFLNQGDGSFAAPVATAVASDSIETRAAVDVQGDGFIDLITDNDLIFSAVIGVHFGRGDGAFGPFQPFSAPVPYGFVSPGDVDGDARVDLVVGHYESPAVSVLIGTEAAIFGGRRDSSLAGAPYDGKLGDLDGDGDVDLAIVEIVEGRRDARVQWNDGTGRFSPGPVIAHSETPAQLRRLELADLDLNGRADVAVIEWRQEGARVRVAAGDPGVAGAFLPPVDIVDAPPLYGPEILDFDADGDPDLAFHDLAGVRVYENRLQAAGSSPAPDFAPSGLSVTAFQQVYDLAALPGATAAGAGALLARVRLEECVEGPPHVVAILTALREPRSLDCDQNAVPDECDIDCNQDRVPDACQTVALPRCAAPPGECTPDCNTNGIGDACDIAEGRSTDSGADGVPDECQSRVIAVAFDGPPRLHGEPGSEVAGEYTCKVIPGAALFGATDGVQGWSLAIRGDGVEVFNPTGTGTAGALHCDDVAGYLENDGFRQIGPARDAEVSGVTAVIVLSFTRPVSLPLQRSHSLLRFSVRARMGPEPESRQAQLVYQDGLRNQAGFPITNVLTRRGASVYPTLFHSTLELTTLPHAFRRGDANADGNLDISDGVHTLQNLFLGGLRGSCRDAADFNDSGAVDISDAVGTFHNLFLGGPRPPAPGRFECGEDPTADGLGCIEFLPCR